MQTVKLKGKLYRIIKRKGYIRTGYYLNGKYIDPVFVAPTTYLKEI